MRAPLVLRARRASRSPAALAAPAPKAALPQAFAMRELTPQCGLRVHPPQLGPFVAPAAQARRLVFARSTLPVP